MAVGKKTGGRQKGTPNKLTKELKEMVLEALENKGGVEYLMLQADENPTAFMTLLGRILPMNVNADIQHRNVISAQPEALDNESWIDKHKPATH